MAPAAARTDVVPLAELLEDTRNLEAPEAGQLVEHMLELVASEAEALLAGDDADGRRADLNVRTALATWDVLHTADEAMRLLELADRHPLAPRLRFSAAIADGDDLALTGVQAAIEGAGGPLVVELAEAWLWRHGRVDAAAALADKAIESPGLRREALELAVLAHASAGRWSRVVALRSAELTEASPPDEVAATAAVILDRANDAAGALTACWAKLEHYPGIDGQALGWLRVFDIAIDAATALADERRYELLEKRGELVAALPGGALEALATRFAVAAELGLEGGPLWVQLAADPAAQLPGAARRVAHFHASWGADRAAALAAHRWLADSNCTEVATTHAWRALELAAALGDPSVGDLAHAVAALTPMITAQRWLDLLEVAAPSEATIVRFEARGGVAIRWAAALVERRGDLAKARELWARAAAEAPLVTTRDHLVRLHRGGDDDELALAYSAWIAAEPDPRCVAALQCARGIVDLARGDFVEAEDSLRRAAELDPKDPFCRAALAAVYRAGKRYDLLAQVLAELARGLASGDARAAAAREHAELLDEHLADPSGARAALERMVAERPDDAITMLALARLWDRGGDSKRAVELRTRAAELAPTPAKRAEIWLQIARDQERAGDRDAALAALERIPEGTAARADVMREQARLYRDSGQLDRALAIVRAELAGDPPLARRMQLQMEIAQLLARLQIEPEAIVTAYLDVLSIEPDQTEALAGIEAPARELGHWDELARAFRGAPQTPRNLEVLAEALAKIAEWSELVEVRRRQLEAATSLPDKAALAAELARLYEHELGDIDGAIRMLLVAQAAQHDDARQPEILRLLRSTQRWAELVAVLERELPTVKPTDVARQLAILLELGELRANRLGRPAEAATAYESALERKPDDATAIGALENLYQQLGRDRELARLLEVRAEATTEPVARGVQFARIAGLRANRNDIEGALSAYMASFKADPTNREVFTAMERVCYKAERWAAAMELYEIAIQHVEAGRSRAYRLGDLYARRGNVLLNFLGQVDAAIVAYQKVIEVDSQPAPAIKALEDLCAQRNDWQPLIAAYEKRAEVQREPTRKAEALRAAAKVSAEHDSARNSVRLQRKLLAIEPADFETLAKLERHYEDAQDHSGLVDILKLRLQHAKTAEDSVGVLKRIARASEEGARDVDTATEYYTKILELQPDNRDALEALGRIYESTEQWAEFIDVTRRQIKVTTDRNIKALLYFRCGSVMEAKFGREHDAIRYYDAAIKTSPSCLPAVHGLRDLYRRREEWPRVIETLEVEVKLWTEDKERAGVFAQIGRIYEKQLGDPERGMHFYESALSVDPDCLPANQSLFEHFFDQGEWDRAQPIANALAQKAMRDGDPTTRSDFYRKRGVVSRMVGEPRAAAESFIVALEIKPTNSAALDDLNNLARELPDAWDFDATYRELDKLYKKRDDANPLLARVHVGRAAIIERDGDLDQAAELYRLALELAPDDFTVLSALVDFHADMRHWAQAVTAIEAFGKRATASPADRLAALMRQAGIHADGEMDPPRAIAVLTEVINVEPSQQDAYYLLAQQYYLLSRHGEARTAIDRVIELATAPGLPLSPAALARYYYYKGRILDAAGDARSAAPQYRRAIEYDPGYAPPALVLARRAAEGGDQRQAETLLIEAAHAAMAQGGPRAAVPLQRGLARILLASGDRPAAIEAYRGILNVEADNPSDRVALAEIYAVDDPQRAIGELRKVLERDIHHAPAYRLLASFYNRTGDTERANRVLTALDLLGFAEETDRATMARLRALRVPAPLRRTLDDEDRQRLLITPAAREPLGEVFEAFAEEISTIVTSPSLGLDLQPAQSADPRIYSLASEVAALYQTDAEIFIGNGVPGLAAVTAFPRRMIVIDRTLLAESDLSIRFLFGYAFEAIRGGYATLLQLGARQRRELAALLRTLVAPETDLTGPAAVLVEQATARAVKVLERHTGLREVDPGTWIDGMLACAKRAGLVACDDFSASIWMVARLTGEQLASHDAAVALGAVLGGSDLVQFYLSDDYQQLRDELR